MEPIFEAHLMLYKYIGLLQSCDSNVKSYKCPLLHYSLLCPPKLYNFHLALYLGVLLVNSLNCIILVAQIDTINSYIESQDYIFPSLMPSSIPKGFQELGVIFLSFLFFLVLKYKNNISTKELLYPLNDILPPNRLIYLLDLVSSLPILLTSYPYSILDKGLLIELYQYQYNTLAFLGFL